MLLSIGFFLCLKLKNKMKYTFKTNLKKLLADTTTPVSIYLRLRDVFPNSILLESSDYHSRDNNISYICCQSIAHIKLDNTQLEIAYPNEKVILKNKEKINLKEEVATFRKAFGEPISTERNIISKDRKSVV